MNPRFHDFQYLDLIKDIVINGYSKGDRTGTGTISAFHRTLRFDLSDGTIPLLTSKRMHIPSILHEILWYLSGDTSIKYLTDNNVRIWKEWADEEGEIGPLYGAMWRRWPSKDGHIDQIGYIINELKTNPESRRLIVSAWNPELLPDPKISFSENVANGKQALPPCHYTFQFYTRPDGDSHVLSLLLNMRSSDVGLGLPFNIAQYSILLRMICHVTGFKPGEFVWSGGDVHIYSNHVEALVEQSSRDPYPSPRLEFARELKSIDDFEYEDFVIKGYEHHPTIKMDVSI